MARYTPKRALLLLVFLPLVIFPVLGAEVAIGPPGIGDRDPISITITNVSDGSLLNTTLTASFYPVEGVTWLNLTSWNYPFTLGEGRVVLAGRNVNQLILLVRAGSGIRMRRESGTGAINLEIPQDFQPSTFHDFRIGYEVHNASEPMSFTLIQRGTKVGTETDVVLTPTIIGITEGDLTVEVLVNGTLVNRTGIRVVKPAPPATPAPVNTTAAPTMAPTEAPTQPATTPPTPTPPPATPTPRQTTPVTTTPPAPVVPSAGPSPFILVYAAIIIIIAVIADYLLMKD